MLKRILLTALLVSIGFGACRAASPVATGLKRPLVVYNNWSAYDELSDTIPQTSALCMRMLDEVLRLKQAGVQVDCYLMDAFWFDVDGGYRVWHKEHWPDGPDAWVRKCRENGIMPGLWFSTNLFVSGGQPMLRPVKEWSGSVDAGGATLSLTEGGYLDHLMQTLQQYADMGIGLFKFDFAYFDAATAATRANTLASEIIENNKRAFIAALRQFRHDNPDVIIIAYNGFGAEMEDTTHPFRKTIDPRWPEVFDTMYSGDPRLSDVPMQNFWRSQDIYSDQMVREMAFNGLPVERIDNCSFMIGETGTCYRRGIAAWRSSLLLNMARGGWLNVMHGNIDLLDDDDARWMARAQHLYLPLQQHGRTTFIGGLPGKSEAFGYKAESTDGAVLTLVNPSQQTLRLPLQTDNSYDTAALLFADSGFSPQIQADTIVLGPEQMAVVGLGRYAGAEYQLGEEPDVLIPSAIKPIGAETVSASANGAKGSFSASVPAGEGIRIALQQCDSKGKPFRYWGGGLPDGRNMKDYYLLNARQGKRSIPLKIQYDKVLWSGLSWATAEIDASEFDHSRPVTLEYSVPELGAGNQVDCRVYSVTY